MYVTQLPVTKLLILHSHQRDHFWPTWHGLIGLHLYWTRLGKHCRAVHWCQHSNQTYQNQHNSSTYTLSTAYTYLSVCDLWLYMHKYEAGIRVYRVPTGKKKKFWWLNLDYCYVHGILIASKICILKAGQIIHWILAAPETRNQVDERFSYLVSTTHQTSLYLAMLLSHLKLNFSTPQSKIMG